MNLATDPDDYIQAVRPAVYLRSDKFSWRLYRHLKKRPYPHTLRVLAHQLDRSDTRTFVPFSVTTAQPAQLFIGYRDEEDWGSGAFLSDIINPSNNSGPSWWAFPPRMFIHAIDVSDWFWPEYARIGRCVWDREHSGFMSGAEERFITEAGEGTRLCTWCGQRQRLVTKRKVIRVDSWVMMEA